MIRDMSGNKCNLTRITVSHWETGKRGIRDEYIDILVKIFDLSSADILLAESSHTAKLSKEDIENGLYPIAFEWLKYLDGEPVYVRFHRKQGVGCRPNDGWSLIDVKHQRLVFKNRDFTFQEVIEQSKGIYATKRINGYPAPGHINAVGIKTVLALEWVYVELKSTDPSMSAKFDGWYHHNEDHTALINANGCVLPYEGVYDMYFAYK